MISLLMALLTAQNYQPYPVAPRAAGMGGTSSALGEGGGNTFYNPAALAFSSSTNLEVAGNVLGVDGTTTSGELGDDSSRTRLGFFIIPANLTLETHGLRLGPLVLSDRWGLGVSLQAPVEYTLHAISSSSDGATVVTRDTQESVYSIYNDLAYRVTDTLGLGFSVVAVYRRYETSLNVSRDGDADYQSIFYQRTEQSLGHALAFGARWKSDSGFRLGTGIRMPLQNVFGTGDERAQTASFDAESGKLERAHTRRRLDVKYQTPWRFNLGLGWERYERWAVAVEATLYTPHSYPALRDLVTGETVGTVELNTVVNLAVGFELYAGKTPLRLGFFTDHSALGMPKPSDPVPERIDRYGGTFSIGFVRALYITELGLLVAAGRVRSLGFDSADGAFSSRVAEGFQWRAMVTLSSQLHYD